MTAYRADLHVHTALSPCADAEMTPPAIVGAACAAKLDLIAICDHNSAANVAAVQTAAARDVAVIAGIEITTTEEVHVVGLFPDARSAMRAGESVTRTLPRLRSRPRGDEAQCLLNAAGNVVGHEKRMLAAASSFPLSSAIALIHGLGGLAIAAHIDRPSFSVISQLGLFPQNAPFDAIEVSNALMRGGKPLPVVAKGRTVVAGSDSHFLSEVGAVYTRFEMAAPDFIEVARALRGEQGRYCSLA